MVSTLLVSAISFGQVNLTAAPPPPPLQVSGPMIIKDNSMGVIEQYRSGLEHYKDLLKDGFLEQWRFEKSGSLSPKVLIQQKPVTAGERCFILKLHEDTDTKTLERVASLLEIVEARVDGSITDLLKAHVVCFNNTSAPLKLLASIKSVEVVETDQKLYIEQWAVDRIKPKFVEKSNFVSKTATSMSAVNVYVVDTGIWTQHGEFNGRASIGYSLFNSRFGSDCNGHGTQVASLIGGQTIGIAPGVNLIGVQAMDCDGSGTVSNMLKALDWVKANAKKPAIVNMSFNGVKSDILDKAIDELIDFGITVVAAAGNSGCDACNRSPSDSSKAIIVGASDKEDRRAKFSNYGRCITLFAPGCNILAASVPFTPKSMFSPAPGIIVDNSELGAIHAHPSDRYVMTSGTSFAAPFVTGSLALLLSRNSSLNPSELREKLLKGSQYNALKPESLNNSPNLLLQLPS